MGRHHATRRSIRASQHGMTLVELMVSLAVGLVIIAAATLLFVNSSQARREVDMSAEPIENGRYGLDALTRELSQAGFYGTLVDTTGTTLAPCSLDPAVWADSLDIVAFGLNNADPDPVCLARKPGTDAVFVQRAATCTTAEAGAACAEVPTQAYMQVSECGAEYNATPVVIALGGNAALKLQTRACDGTLASKRRFIRRFFYVDAADVLNYVDITPSGPSAPVPIVENIEQMQVEYGIDADGDGTPERFAPTTPDWTQVIGARVWLLARSADPSGNTSAAARFEMSDTVVDIAAAARLPKRRVYTTFIPFVTPKSRREY